MTKSGVPVGPGWPQDHSWADRPRLLWFCPDLEPENWKRHNGSFLNLAQFKSRSGKIARHFKRYTWDLLIKPIKIFNFWKKRNTPGFFLGIPTKKPHFFKKKKISPVPVPNSKWLKFGPKCPFSLENPWVFDRIQLQKHQIAKIRQIAKLVHNKTVEKMEDLLQLVQEGIVHWGAGASKNGDRRPPFLRVR